MERAYPQEKQGKKFSRDTEKREMRKENLSETEDLSV